MTTVPDPSWPALRWPDRHWHARVWRLAGPLILSNLTTPLLGIADSAVVGHLPDPVYLAAVALGTVVFNTVFWLFGFLRMGTIGLTAQALGAEEPEEIRAVLARAAMAATAIGCAIVLLQVPLYRLAVLAMAPSADVAVPFAGYFDIRIWAAPAMLLDYVIVGWLVGMQYTRGALYMALFINVVNIGLDLLFVVGFGWAARGVAAATVIAHCAALAFGVLLLRYRLKQVAGSWARSRILDGAELRRLFAINRDIFLRTLMLTLSHAALTAIASRLGDLVLAANAVIMNLHHFMTFAVDGFSHAVQALCGRATGARDRREFRQAVVATSLWGVAFALVFTAVYAVAGQQLVGLITSIPEVRATTAEFVFWVAVSPVLSIWTFLLDGIFLGATRTAAMRNAMALAVLVYVAALLLLVPAFGNHGLWLSLMIFFAARGLTLAIRYPALERSVGDGH
ncbi:MAG: MATE family efflux transporter [Acetobacterales bacterium]